MIVAEDGTASKVTKVMDLLKRLGVSSGSKFLAIDLERLGLSPGLAKCGFSGIARQRGIV